MSSAAARPSMRDSRGGKSSVKGSSRRPGDTSSSKMGASKVVRSGMAGKRIPEQGPAAVVVRDEFGNDVTPKALLTAAQPPAKPAGGADDSRLSSESQSSMFEQPARMSSLGGSEGDVSGKIPEMVSVSDMEPSEVTSSKPKASAPAEEPTVTMLSEEDLNEMVEIILVETDTFFLIDMPGECVDAYAPDVESVKAQNARYEELLEKRQTMADQYVESSAQTFNLEKKTKEVQTAPIKSQEMGCMATEWDLYDTMVAGAKEQQKETDVELELVGGGGPAKAAAAVLGGASGEGSSFAASGTEQSSLESSSGVGGMGGIEGVDEASTASPTGKAAEVSLSSLRGLPQVLRIIERMVSQNNYGAKQLAYRNIKSVSATAQLLSSLEERSHEPSFSLLWSFLSETQSKGRNISSLEWNPGNRDLLAVAYGEFDFERQQNEGLVLFWSLKNPDSPDKAIRTPCGVTAIASSVQHPNLLAVGLYDGTVCVYDVRKNDSRPILESGHGSGGKHTDPVWQLEWVNQGKDKGEMLVSISSDGRVTKWDMKKGLENQDLMKLKRVVSSTKKPGGEGNASGGSEGIISRRASGMCVAFAPKDPNYYLAGTEDGLIHKCSCSYNEQHLETYSGHSGPVYKLRWSPYCPNTFISCSADWSIKLWNQENPQAIFTFNSSTDYVADIAWSPTNSTVFASVTGDGRVDVWDVSINTLDPIAYVQTGKRLSTVAFSLASPVLVVGHEGGGVDVYSLEGSLAEETGRTIAEQIAALDKVTSTVADV